MVLFCSFPKTFVLSEKGRIGGLGILNTAFSLSSICFKRELWVEIFIISSKLFFLFFLAYKESCKVCLNRGSLRGIFFSIYILGVYGFDHYFWLPVLAWTRFPVLFLILFFPPWGNLMSGFNICPLFLLCENWGRELTLCHGHIYFLVNNILHLQYPPL